jgi:hypothetical protein
MALTNWLIVVDGSGPDPSQPTAHALFDIKLVNPAGTKTYALDIKVKLRPQNQAQMIADGVAALTAACTQVFGPGSLDELGDQVYQWVLQ